MRRRSLQRSAPTSRTAPSLFKPLTAALTAAREPLKRYAHPPFHLQQTLIASLLQSLDIQYTVGVATNVPTTFISVGNNNQDGDLGGFLDIINFLLGESNPPQVLTTSYGDNESDISRSLAK